MFGTEEVDPFFSGKCKHNVLNELNWQILLSIMFFYPYSMASWNLTNDWFMLTRG